MSEDFFRHKLGPGWIELIVGCMFSGKTEELIKQLKRAKYGQQAIQSLQAKN
jgi:thymidine kinase